MAGEGRGRRAVLEWIWRGHELELSGSVRWDIVITVMKY